MAEFLHLPDVSDEEPSPAESAEVAASSNAEHPRRCSWHYVTPEICHAKRSELENLTYSLAPSMHPTGQSFWPVKARLPSLNHGRGEVLGRALVPPVSAPPWSKNDVDLDVRR